MGTSRILLLLLLVAGCTNQQVYNGAREANRQECQKLQQGEMQRCLQRLDVNYDEYQRQREELLKEPAGA